jgi:hypothetical protein
MKDRGGARRFVLARLTSAASPRLAPTAALRAVLAVTEHERRARA